MSPQDRLESGVSGPRGDHSHSPLRREGFPRNHSRLETLNLTDVVGRGVLTAPGGEPATVRSAEFIPLPCGRAL